MTPREKESVTIRDVAKKAGVSPGTVSRAINNSPLVNDATRRRILKVVADMDYTPNLAARRLSIGKTLAVAVIVPYFTRPSVSERLNGAVSLLSKSRYDLVIHNIETPEQRAICFEKIPRREQADGVLIISLSPTDAEAQKLAQADIPIVLIDADHPALTMFPHVTVDDVAGGRMATEYLLELGHNRIGFIGDSIGDTIGGASAIHFTSSRERYQGYCQALQAAQLDICPHYYGEDQHGREEARQLAMDMLTQPDRPTAIFAASDPQAVGVLEAARALGIPVPEALSVIGYDDIELADIMQLTTMRQLLFESGRLGVELLLEQLENPETEPVLKLLPVELVVRRTTAPPSGRV
jgi:DNA-binding LacI/PurR family transcriptional regulator